MCDERSRSWPSERAHRLAERVRWLDRYRRVLALLAAALVAPFLIVQVGEVLGAEWQEMPTTLLSLMLVVIVWWIVEVGLIYLMALWDGEHDRLVRDHGLPRATARKPRG